MKLGTEINCGATFDQKRMAKEMVSMVYGWPRMKKPPKKMRFQAEALGVEVRQLPDVVGHHAAQRHRNVRSVVVLEVLVLCEMWTPSIISSQVVGQDHPFTAS